MKTEFNYINNQNNLELLQQLQDCEYFINANDYVQFQIYLKLNEAKISQSDNNIISKIYNLSINDNDEKVYLILDVKIIDNKKICFWNISSNYYNNNAVKHWFMQFPFNVKHLSVLDYLSKYNFIFQDEIPIVCEEKDLIKKCKYFVEASYTEIILLKDEYKDKLNFEYIGKLSLIDDNIFIAIHLYKANNAIIGFYFPQSDCGKLSDCGKWSDINNYLQKFNITMSEAYKFYHIYKSILNNENRSKFV